MRERGVKFEARFVKSTNNIAPQIGCGEIQEKKT
jgi:hypothetical protein